MKRVYSILLSAVLIIGSCTSDSEDPDPNAPVVIEGWTQKEDFYFESPYARSVAIDGKAYILWGSGLWEYDAETNKYTTKADFPGPPRFPHGPTFFRIGNKAYLGFGAWVDPNTPDSDNRKDFWEYDPQNNKWTQKSDFPRAYLTNGLGISIGDKGYVIGGYNNTTIDGIGFVETYEYDPAKDTWTRKSDLPTKPRVLKVGFGFSDKGYVGVSEDLYNYYKDFWQYDPAKDEWTRKNDFPTFTPPVVSFSNNNLGYTYGGELSLNGVYYYTNDVYEYHPDTDGWIKKNDFPAEGRNTRVGFGVNNKIYIGMGRKIQSPDLDFKDLWEYTP